MPSRSQRADAEKKCLAIVVGDKLEAHRATSQPAYLGAQSAADSIPVVVGTVDTYFWPLAKFHWAKSLCLKPPASKPHPSQSNTESTRQQEAGQ